MKGYIYKITSPSGRIYIGQTTNLRSRVNSYKYNHCKKQPKIYNSILKHGWMSHVFEIIEEINFINKDDLDAREIFWIDFYESVKNGLNCTKGGGGSLGIKHSEATRLKNRLAHLGKGHPHTEETKRHLSEKHKGKIISESQRAKARANNLGKKYSEAELIIRKDAMAKFKGIKRDPSIGAKISKSKMGHTVSQESRDKISQKLIGSIPGNKGKKYSEEQRARLILSRKGQMKKVICVETGVVYDSLADAGKSIGATKGSIWRSLNGVRKTIRNKSFKYLNAA